MNAPVRLTLERTGNIRKYLWVKAVRGVDLATHCAQSLVGTYLQVDRRDWRADLLLPSSAGVRAWYVCGVTDPYFWAHNDHALVLPEPGWEDQLSTPGYVLTVTNGRFLVPSEDWVPQDTPNADNPRFATCRNWQAAHWLHRFADLPNGRSSRTS